MARTVRVGKLRFPLDRRYGTERAAHVWLLPGKDNTARLGLDDFLTKTAGFLNYILLDGRSSVRKGGSLGSFESAKFVSKLRSPISGKVVAVNEAVVRNPRLVNHDPYSSWIVEVRADDLGSQLSSPELLGDERRVRRWAEEELRRAEADE